MTSSKSMKNGKGIKRQAAFIHRLRSLIRSLSEFYYFKNRKSACFQGKSHSSPSAKSDSGGSNIYVVTQLVLLHGKLEDEVQLYPLDFARKRFYIECQISLLLLLSRLSFLPKINLLYR